jgi:hypothetical protein
VHARGQRFRRIQLQSPALDLQQRRDIEFVELDGQLRPRPRRLLGMTRTITSSAA